jgi:orotidine-5'-phosphate decarboxylase
MLAAAGVASSLQVKMFNVYADSGIAGMTAAVAGAGNSLVLAVTVLTSLTNDDVSYIYSNSTTEMVLQFALDAKRAGCNGVVCSPKELEMLGRHQELNGFLKVTPGVRPEWAEANDQKRIMTPGEAILAGADYLVIGRPITNPPQSIGTPVDAARRIATEIDSVVDKGGE